MSDERFEVDGVGSVSGGKAAPSVEATGAEPASDSAWLELSLSSS